MYRFFGGNPIAAIVRLVILSVVVGIIMAALQITPQNLIHSVKLFGSRLYDMGFGAITWGFGYFLLGAMVVVPVWLVARAIIIIRGETADRTAKRRKQGAD